MRVQLWQRQKLASMSHKISSYIECYTCGGIYPRSPSGVNPTGQNFCGHPCFTLWKTGRTQEKAGGWKGGLRVSDGRVFVLMPDHPYASKDGYILRYRLVMEHHLGRFLLPGEIVHHEDHQPMNDDPANLKVLLKSEHDRLHEKLRGGINGKRRSRA